MLAVLADPAPSADALVALVALVPRGREVWDLYEYIGMSLARGRDKPVPWEVLGRASGTSKQAAQQRFERRQRDGARLEARRPELGRARATTREWLDEHANQLRGLVAVLTCHHSELIALSPAVAVAVHEFGAIHYMYGDADVLAGARKVVTAIRAEEQERTRRPSWDQYLLSARAWAAFERLEEFIAAAP
ncbi:hypothetical protein [Nonomuraea recticatena]|uniref:Uncharacterized protein n=1 Tax=Nonomuraea recticatena TaxID=46178 RepID=A0ABP6FW43_9ACTN